MSTEIRIADTVLSLIKGDITEQSTEAIVNAANSRLAGGGGVDGAIHRAAGPEIMKECAAIGNCPTGAAVMTTAGRLAASKVIHTVGPIYKDGRHHEQELLAGAYRSSLKLASENGLKTIAFPSLSTGAYGYPTEEASKTALSTVIDFIKNNPNAFTLVRFVLFSDSDYETYRKTLEEITA
ncbi:MAG: O-acetyl-ADP-ribose deacetylase [Thermodesulfobacteriota bacterium]